MFEPKWWKNGEVKNLGKKNLVGIDSECVKTNSKPKIAKSKIFPCKIFSCDSVIFRPKWSKYWNNYKVKKIWCIFLSESIRNQGSRFFHAGMQCMSQILGDRRKFLENCPKLSSKFHDNVRILDKPSYGSGRIVRSCENL